MSQVTVDVEVLVLPENKEQVIAGLKEVVKPNSAAYPVIQPHKSDESKVCLLYQGVTNQMEIMSKAIFYGAEKAAQA